MINEYHEKSKLIVPAVKKAGSGSSWEKLYWNLPVPAYQYDLNGYIVHYNKKAEELSGKKLIIGLDKWFDDYDYLDENGHIVAWESSHTYQSIRSGQVVENQEIRIIHGNYVKYFQISTVPTFTDDQQMNGCMAVVMDITEKKESVIKAHKKERLLARSEQIANMGTWEWDFEDHNIIWSENFCRIVGYTPENYPGTFEEALDHVPVEDRERVLRSIWESCESGQPYHIHHRMVRVDGEVISLMTYGEVELDQDGKAKKVTGVSRNVTMEQAKENELETLSLIAKTTDNMVIVTDEGDRIEWVNNAFLKKYGYKKSEVLGNRPYEILDGPKTNPAVRKRQLEKINQQEPHVCELLCYTKEKKPVWVEVQGQPVFNERGEFVNYYRLGRDITAKKRSIEKLIQSRDNIKSYAHNLNKEIEKERSRLARELHDELGQILSGLKMSLALIKNNLNGQKTVESMDADIDRAMHSVKKIATELRPGILDTMGLIPSLEWMVNETKKRSGILCEFVSKAKQEVFDDETSITFFRVCQEGLNNAVKHSGAALINISISFRDNILLLKLQDNGMGMSAKLKGPLSLGLLGMYERAELNGAYLKIDSGKTGTCIVLKKKILT